MYKFFLFASVLIVVGCAQGEQDPYEEVNTSSTVEVPAVDPALNADSEIDDNIPGNNDVVTAPNTVSLPTVHNVTYEVVDAYLRLAKRNPTTEEVSYWLSISKDLFQPELIAGIASDPNYPTAGSSNQQFAAAVLSDLFPRAKPRSEQSIVDALNAGKNRYTLVTELLFTKEYFQIIANRAWKQLVPHATVAEDGRGAVWLNAYLNGLTITDLYALVMSDPGFYNGSPEDFVKDYYFRIFGFSASQGVINGSLQYYDLTTQEGRYWWSQMVMADPLFRGI
jgi:hypothetical protein